MRLDINWREEAWGTLTHELRHHLEWRANTAALEAYDWAAEQNFARHEGEPFDAIFYRSGERVADGVYKVDDDVFVERAARSGIRDGWDVTWHGRRYRVPGAGVRPPAFLTLHGLDEPPPGEAVLVVPHRTTLFNFWRRPTVTEAVVAVEELARSTASE